jgi:hypothetical protein
MSNVPDRLDAAASELFIGAAMWSRWRPMPLRMLKRMEAAFIANRSARCSRLRRVPFSNVSAASYVRSTPAGCAPTISLPLK